VDGYLIADVHLVELVDGTDPVVCKHEGTGFDCKFAGFFVLDYGCCETGC